MSWYVEAIKKFGTFSGRARRKEYWMFFLVNVVIEIVIGIISGILGSISKDLIIVGTIITGLYGLFIFVPALACVVRRLHDVNKSGAWIFISLVPIVGAIWLLVLLCTEGTRGANNFGEDPKAN